MTDNDMRRLFDAVLADPKPDSTSLDAAMRDGRLRRRRRTAAVMGSCAAALVTGGLILGGAFAGEPQPTRVASPSPSVSATDPSALVIAAIPGEKVTDHRDLAGSWIAVRLQGKSVTSSWPDLPSLTFTELDGEPTWTAYDGCNGHWAGYSLSATGAFLSKGDGTSLRACGQTLYASSITALRNARSVRLGSFTEGPPLLTLLDANGTAVATYVPYTWAAMEPVEHAKPGEQPSRRYLASYVGMTADAAAARAMTDGWTPRICPPRGTLTSDFIAHRLTIYIDEAGVVTRTEVG
jgi:hypothetical protein